MAERITDALVRALPIPEKDSRIVFDDQIPGFGVRAWAPPKRHPEGSKVFILDCRIGGAQ